MTNPAHVSGVARAIHNACTRMGRNIHRGSLFGYAGDVVDQDIKIVQLDNDLFSITLPSYIQTDVDAQIQLLVADLNIQLAAVPDAAAADTNTAKAHSTTNCKLIPAPLMPYVLTEPPRNVQQTLEVLVATISALDLEDTCGPLVNFLIFATTDNNAGAAPDTVQL